MIQLLQLLFLGHAHKWKIIKTGKYADFDDTFGPKRIIAQGNLHTLQCEHCGKLKVFKE